MPKIAIFDGYNAPFHRIRRRRRSGGRTAQQRRFSAAAKACKGKGRGFRACMKKKLRG